MNWGVACYCAGGSWWEGTTNNRAFALARVNANATRSEDSFTDEERQLIVASWRTTGTHYCNSNCTCRAPDECFPGLVAGAEPRVHAASHLGMA
jgi:hypothetical protein